MRLVWTVARRELKALLDHPMGYILLVVFVGVNNFLFLRQIDMTSVATLRPMLALMPWLLLFLVPAVTMRALAEDIRGGTLEIVLAQPLTELELLLGKYLGQVLFLLLALALTLGIPIGLALGADIQVGVIVAQYLSVALLICGLAAIGVWASSVTPNQITAFILAVAVTFAFILVGLDPLLVGLPASVATIAAWFGVLTHFESVTRGLVDLRDVVYFVSLAGAFLALSYLSLLRRKLSPRGQAARRLRTGVALLVAGAVLVSLVMQSVSWRLDLTPGRAYTLARGTRNILGNLPDLVTLKLYASSELPPEAAFLRRDIDDILRDYRSAGRGKVRLVVRDPAADSTAAREARELSIPPVQFNVVGQGQLSIKEGWLGIAVQHAGESKVIPFVRQTDDLEYRLTSEIRALTHPAKPHVGLYTRPAETQASPQFHALQSELEKAYDVRAIQLSDTTPLGDSLLAVVALGTPDTLNAGQLARFGAFVARGGSMLVFAGGMQLQQQGFANRQPVGWNALLARYGLAIHGDMAYDLLSNESVALPTQFGRVLMSYPFWLRALSTKASAINAELDAVFVPWGSTLGIDTTAGGGVTPLFTTSRGGRAEQGFVMIEPRREFRRDSLGVQTIVALVNPLAGDTTKLPRGRLVVAGSADMVSDRFVQNAPGNIQFALNAVDWLAQDEALIAIRAKNRAPPPLTFTSPITRGIARYGNMVAIPLLIVLVAILRLLRRRRRTGRPYVPTAAPAGASA